MFVKESTLPKSDATMGPSKLGGECSGLVSGSWKLDVFSHVRSCGVLRRSRL